MADKNVRNHLQSLDGRQKRLKTEEYCLICQEYGHAINGDCAVNATCLDCGAKGHVRKDCLRFIVEDDLVDEVKGDKPDVDEVKGDKPVVPADIDTAIHQDNLLIGGKNDKADTPLLRFAKVEERINVCDFDARNRRLAKGGGLLSRSKRQKLLAARDQQLDREQAEREREVDGKNPWGSIAENWGSDGRREHPIHVPLKHKDWDAPVDEFSQERVQPLMSEGVKMKRSIKDRFMDEDFKEREDEATETFISEWDDDTDDSDIEWTKKRKRPRMGSVAHVLEKKNVKDRIGGGQKQKKVLIKRKIANKPSIEVFEKEKEVGDLEDEKDRRRVDWRDGDDLRPMLSLTKRLNERFRGGRLAGRLGDGIKSDGSVSLENDDGEDLKIDFENAANMVIQVHQSDDETMDEDLKHEDRRGRETESSRTWVERERRERYRSENEAREKRREEEREKKRKQEKEREKLDLKLERMNRLKKDQERDLSRLKDREREKRRDRDGMEEKTRRADKHQDKVKVRHYRENGANVVRHRELERERKDRDREREQDRRRHREKEMSKATSYSTSRKKRI